MGNSYSPEKSLTFNDYRLPLEIIKINKFVIFVGKFITSIRKSPFSKEQFSDYGKNSYRDPLDNDQFIGFAFNCSNYVTLMSENWAKGVSRPIKQKASSKQQTRHNMKCSLSTAIVLPVKIFLDPFSYEWKHIKITNLQI